MKTLYGEYRKTLLSLLLSSSPLIVLIAILIAMCLYHEPQWEKDRKAARLALSGITSRHFDLLPDEVKKDPVALSKRINAFIYNYCTCEQPLEKNLTLLPVNCRTSCAGYVHVFRQIADRYGIASRSVYLFNIPFQGNHSMVEIRYGEDRWALFDPTFGTFFTPHGEPSDTPYSLDELYFQCSPDSIVHNIVQARKSDDMDMSPPIDVLYARNSFHAAFFESEAYLSAEAYGTLDRSEYSMLWMNIDMEKGFFQFGRPAADTIDGEKEFLSQTNALLNDDIAGNQISYNMSFLGEVGGHVFKNGYHFSGLMEGRTYRITLHGTNADGVPLYPHFTDTGAVLRHTGMHKVPAGTYEYSMLFRARNTRADLILEVYPGSGSYLRVFGVVVEPCD